VQPDALIEYATEVGNCDRFIRANGGNIKYCPQTGLWYFWGGARWRVDDVGHIVEMMKVSNRKLWDLTGTTDNERADRIRFARQSESDRSIRATINLAKSVSEVVVRQEQLDADPMMAGCPGGVIDFKSGVMRPGQRGDLITKSLAVNPADSPCPQWLSVLDRSFAENKKLIAYIGRIFGLSLTGVISVQEFFIFWGGGANGKSLILGTILGIMGEYGGIAPDSLLTAKSPEHPTEVAGLFGKRCIVASETEEGAKLRIQTVKKLTGDVLIKGRLMRQDYQEVKRTFKLILVTNNRPRISEQSNAVWRRVKCVPFEVTIPAGEQDAQLLEKLKAEWPAILNWCIRGCLDWQANGMRTPDEVVLATAAYQDESDPLAEYVADRIVFGSECRVSRNDLYADYQSYCVQAGDKSPLSRKAFIDHAQKLSGVAEKQWRPVGSNVPMRGFSGLGLRSGAENEDVAACSSATTLSALRVRNTEVTENRRYNLLHATSGEEE
jgi:putative DNA primase/helicase